ncbi:helix-turn-helix domain-containing protein [bacterium]|nr:helix-turn-helix domain-containing protein [bacterium]
MSKLHTALNSEITRLARREVRQAVTPLLAAIRKLKDGSARLKAEIEALKSGRAQAGARPAVAVSDAELKAARFSGRLIRKLRTRLGLTAAEMAKLMGVSSFSVFAWEGGRIRPRQESQKALIALRKLNKRDVRKMVKEGKSL